MSICPKTNHFVNSHRNKSIYQKNVKEEYLKLNDQAGNSKVDSLGTPVVFINPLKGLERDVIIHELYHFVQRDEGFPVIEWLLPSHWDIDKNRKGLEQLNIQIHDPILHYIFFPVIRSWGINPNGSVERQTKQFLENDSLPKVFEGMDVNAIALYYFMINLTFENKDLLNQVINSLLENGNLEGINLGKQLTQIVIDSNPKSPQDDIVVVVKCLNVLYSGKLHFKQHPWKSHQLGNHKQMIAPIEIKAFN